MTRYNFDNYYNDKFPLQAITKFSYNEVNSCRWVLINSNTLKYKILLDKMF